jgi:hypothetical protein
MRSMSRSLTSLRDMAQSKIPEEWGPGEEVLGGGGWRWSDPKNPSGNGVRVVPGIQGLPEDCPGAEDHVHVRSDGRVIGSHGKPVPMNTAAVDAPAAEYPEMRVCLLQAAQTLATEAFRWPDDWDYLEELETVGDFAAAMRSETLVGPVLLSSEELARYAELVSAINALVDEVGGRVPFVEAARSEHWPVVRRAAQALAG